MDTGPTTNTTRRWWPWQVCVFLLFATALSYLDRQALSVVAPLVSRELSLDNAELGLLLSAFFYSYAVMHLFVGWILDRYNIRVTYALFVALWSLAQIASGLARGFGGLFTARLFLGTFETAGQTGAARIIARILPGRDRAFANGIMMSGGSLGAMVAGPLMIWLANSVGWRVGFMLLGGVGLVWAAAWLAWFRPSREVLYGARRDRHELPDEDRWGVILRSPKFWACVAGAAFTIPIIHVTSSWVPTYFVQRWGLSLSTGLEVYLFFIYLGSDLGFMGGGALVSLLSRRGLGVAAARKAVMALAAGLMLAAALVPVMPSAPAAVAMIFLLNTGRAAWGAIFLAFNQDIAPGRVGMVAGIMGCVGSLAGALLVWLIGVISKASGFGLPFVMIAGLAAAGLLPVLLVRWESEEGADLPGFKEKAIVKG
jgi:predicted MFS family arabinose efflux permease